MHLTNWKARRAGATITINGHSEHGEPRKIVGVTVIECGPHGFFAIDRTGTKHTLADA